MPPPGGVGVGVAPNTTRWRGIPPPGGVGVGVAPNTTRWRGGATTRWRGVGVAPNTTRWRGGGPGLSVRRQAGLSPPPFSGCGGQWASQKSRNYIQVTDRRVCVGGMFLPKLVRYVV